MKTATVVLFTIAALSFGVAVVSGVAEYGTVPKPAPQPTNNAVQDEIDKGLRQNRERADEGSILSLEEFAFSEENVKRLCAKDNRRDEMKVNDCIEWQTDAYVDLRTFVRMGYPEPWMYIILPKIWEKWTDYEGLTSYQLVTSSVITESDKYLDYQDMMASPNLDRERMQRCADLWEDHGSRWSMTLYCYKRDSDGTP